MLTVAQINSALSAYLPVSDGSSGATTALTMLNQVVPRINDLGNWKAMQTEIELDASSGYVTLPPDYESILAARLNDIPIRVNGQFYEYQEFGPGLLEPPVSQGWGVIDYGFVPLMSDIATSGVSEFTFTLTSGAFASGDNITVEYSMDGSFATFTSNPTSGTSVTLTPATNIMSVESIKFTSLPGRVVVGSPDDTNIIYAILPPGDGVAQYRRYKVPQPSTDTDDEWVLTCLVKRRFVPLTSTSDIVYLDNLTALKHAFLAVVAEDNSDLDRAAKHWAACEKQLQSELTQTRGGARGYPNISIWGAGVAPLQSFY